MRFITKLAATTLLVLAMLAPMTAQAATSKASAYSPDLEMTLEGFSLSSYLEEYTPESFAEEVVKYTNQFRQNNGLAPLEMDASLNEVAMARLVENDGEITHTRPDGSAFHTVITQFDTQFKAAGENLILAPATPEWIVEYLSGSPSHRAGLLNEKATHIGVAIEFVDMDSIPRVYVAQFFAR